MNQANESSTGRDRTIMFPAQDVGGDGDNGEPEGGTAGLCAICERAGSCAIERDATHPIQECADFRCRPLEESGARRGGLIAVLEYVQNRYGYLPVEALKVVAAQMGRSLVDVYGVATFYRFFSLKPRGKHLVSVCLGTACHVRGGPAIAREVQQRLGIAAGETSLDGEFTLETVNCLGACALGPVVVVDGHYFSKVGIRQASEILNKARAGLDTVEITTDQRVFPIEVSCPRCNHSLMDNHHPVDGYPSIRVTLAFNESHGWLALSSLYGSYDVESEHPIPPDTVVQFYCPHCHAELSGGHPCVECGAPMVPMIVRGGGVVQICSRQGCEGHMLDLS